MSKVLGFTNTLKTQLFKVILKDIKTALAVFFFVLPKNIHHK